MIGTEYAPGLPAEPAKTPSRRLRRRTAAKVAASAPPKGSSASFVVDRWPEDGPDKRGVVLRRRDLGRSAAGRRRA
nr:MAG TPA: hypothetical protein [Caudoviricetes sp.]